VAIPSQKPQNRILLVGGIFFALLAGVVVFLAVNKGSGTPTNPGNTEQVVVANTTISAGQAITAAQVTTAAYSVPSGHDPFYTTPSDVVGKTAAITIAPGTPIVESMLATAGSSVVPVTGTQPLIAEGYAGLAIPTHLSTADTTIDQMTVGYQIQAGDQIDIVGQYPKDANTAAFGYVFQDVPVLSVGYTTSPSAASPSASPAAQTLQAPAWLVVEMPEAEAVQMTALLTGNLVAVPSPSAVHGLVLKYVLRPADQYGKFATTTNHGVASTTFTPVLLPGVPTLTLPGAGSPLNFGKS
jgi:Flp pilus assembly protein CpaB